MNYRHDWRLCATRKPQASRATVTYELNDKENPYNKTTHMLAHYAEYANIGGNKTAAYGQTKLNSPRIKECFC